MAPPSKPTKVTRNVRRPGGRIVQQPHAPAGQTGPPKPSQPRSAYLENYLSNTGKMADEGTLKTNNWGDSRTYYYEGMARDHDNYCEFRVPGKVVSPNVIRLPLPPSGITWDYNLRYQAYDTIGGQVVQILGVDIKNVTLSGLFGFESHWGKRYNRGRVESLYETEGKMVPWRDDPNVRNGLLAFAHWFRSYFNAITQAGDYDKVPMRFSYPHKGYEWVIRPYSFPSLRFANDEVAPKWEIQCDIVEELQGHVTKDITSKVKFDLKGINNGVGFTEFIQWSEPQYKDPSKKAEAVRSLGEKYGAYVDTFDEEQIKYLRDRGFSYPALGDWYARNATGSLDT